MAPRRRSNRNQAAAKKTNQDSQDVEMAAPKQEEPQQVEKQQKPQQVEKQQKPQQVEKQQKPKPQQEVQQQKPSEEVMQQKPQEEVNQETPQEEEKQESQEGMDTTENKDGEFKRKRWNRFRGPFAKRKARIDPRNQQPKNALMRLNEIKPGLQYHMEQNEGSAQDPIFVVSVNVNEEKFIGKGRSKQLAKRAAAEAALMSFVQFRDMPEIANIVSRKLYNMDFTMDVQSTEIPYHYKFGPSENGTGPVLDNETLPSVSEPAPMASSTPIAPKMANKIRKIISEASKKNPIMLLNEIHSKLTYNLVAENPNISSRRFVMSVEIDGEVFEAAGQNKKAAKAAVARTVLTRKYDIDFNLFSIAPVCDEEAFNFPQTIADEIAKCVHDTFKDVLAGDPEHAKYKVLAAFVMTRDDAMNDIQVISIGTGTKSLNGKNISKTGAVLNDCHAEILAHRCLKDFFYTQLELYLEGEGDLSIFQKKADGKYCLKDKLKFHLFITTVPCGDARVFSVHDSTKYDHPYLNIPRPVLRTKVETGEGTVPVDPTATPQTWDDVIKEKRSYSVMSCSDKISAWNILGLQGSLLTQFIEPIYLNSILLGRLFQQDHTYSSLCTRVERTLGNLPEGFRLNKPKLCGTADLLLKPVTESPPDFGINWSVGLGRPEVVIANTGKQESGQASRLSKMSFFKRFANIYSLLCAPTESQRARKYSMMKAAAKDYHTVKDQVRKAFSDASLSTWIPKIREQDEFQVKF